MVLAAMNEQELFDLELKVLVEAIYQRYHYDFRNYAVSSLRRRMHQAMQRYDCARLSDLQHRLLHEPELFTQAMQFFTVQVSEMFRDPAYFQALREHVVPHLSTYPSLKIWIAGCSTGEEVYSMAILLKEEGLLERTMIYATDINPRSLEKARKGVFPLDAMREYTANYQLAGGSRSFSDYYTAAYNAALFDKSLCDNVTFADHSLATDSVFAETHLISCRNVMIYFKKKLQERAFGLFHESLCHRGFLGLGSKESIDFSSYAPNFEPVMKRDRLFRKR